MSKRETVEVLFIPNRGEYIIPFNDTYECFQKNVRNNPDYGYIVLKSYNYMDELDTIVYDCNEFDIQVNIATTTLYGKLTDLQLFLKSNCYNLKIPGKIVGGKYTSEATRTILGRYKEDIPAKFRHNYRHISKEYLYVVDERGNPLKSNNKDVFRFTEFKLTETLYTDNSVKVLKNFQGGYINVYHNQEYGYIKVCDEAFEVSNGHLELKTRVAEIKGTVKALEEFIRTQVVINDELPGRIVVKEFSESEVPEKYQKWYNWQKGKSYEEMIFPYIKREGEGIVVRSKYNERILSFKQYVNVDSTETDTLVEYNFDPELDEWRDNKYYTDKNYADYFEREEIENSDEYRNQISHTEWLKEIEGDAFDNDPMNYWNVD